MSMGSDDLEAFGMNSYGNSHEDEEHSMSIGERYGYEESYEMSSDELSFEDGEDCVDDFGVEQEGDEPMSYEDFQHSQRGDNDDSVEGAELFPGLRCDEQDQLKEEQELIWKEDEIEQERVWLEQEYEQEQRWKEEHARHEREEDSSDEDYSYSSLDDRWVKYGSLFKELSWFDRNAFGLTDPCACEQCMAVYWKVLHDLSSVKKNSSEMLVLELRQPHTQHFTDEGWHLLGRFIGNNNQVQRLDFSGVTLTDRNISLLSKEMQRNGSVDEIIFADTSLGVEGIRRLEPVLRLKTMDFLCFNRNRVGDEGLEAIGRALASSPIQYLLLDDCDIKEVSISDGFPKYLDHLSLCYNTINSAGCLALAQLLQREDSTLQTLLLRDNFIDDEGASILATSLRKNKTLTCLDLRGNPISEIGHGAFFSLVNDMSSIRATLSSNHTLEDVKFGKFGHFLDESDIMYLDDYYVDACLYSCEARFMQDALNVNSSLASPEQAGRKKVINTQLNIIQRDWFFRLQGVRSNDSLFSDIDCSLHLLPEMLALIGEHHGLSEMYAATLTSISTLTSLSISKEELLKIRRTNLSLDMKDAAEEIKALLLADIFTREDHFRKENLIHEMGGIHQYLVELDRELFSMEFARRWVPPRNTSTSLAATSKRRRKRSRKRKRRRG